MISCTRRKPDVLLRFGVRSALADDANGFCQCSELPLPTVLLFAAVAKGANPTLDLRRQGRLGAAPRWFRHHAAKVTFEFTVIRPD